MKVVVTGATGNVGSSTVKALGASSEIEEIVGIARREPNRAPPKASWVEALEERGVRERLEDLGGKPSKLKDAAGVGGGRAMAAFAASRPDPPAC